MIKREYPDRPFVGVGVVVLGEQGVLLIQRGNPPRQGSWSLPGGGQNLGEKVEDCALREVREETGMEISLIGLIDVVNSIQMDDHNNVRFHYTLVDFAAHVSGGMLVPGDDAMDARWFTRRAIGEMDLWAETVRVIDLAIESYETLYPLTEALNAP
jgi:8-oxo-dGTP diphosphatase